MPKLTGDSWTCSGCGALRDGFPSRSQRDADLIRHAKGCRKLPPGSEVRDTRTNKLLYRKR
jgi:hypothetical protein